MLISILDGYTDEPSRLGVPPFMAAYPRYLAGAVLDAGEEFEYFTVDQWRNGREPIGQMLFIISNANVPGKYLGGTPVSEREVIRIKSKYDGEAIVWSSTGSKGDVDALAHDMLTTGTRTPRRRTFEEWRKWSVHGAGSIGHHPDFPQSLILEIDMSFGCPRFVSGGCSFCPEIGYGEPVFRPQEDIVEEMKALLKSGAANFRLGGQSCLFTYMTEYLGEDAPRPNVRALRSLFKGISELKGIRVLHTDNANPGIMASYPKETMEILDALVKTCTGGNLLSMGMESADPVVIEANNLNATPDQIMEAVRMVNRVGSQVSETGMPRLLPGLNLVCGLDGETSGTFDLNFNFLKSILERGLMLRRINIRQVAPTRREFHPTRLKKEFIRFKERVRKEIDGPMLKMVIPAGTVLKDVYMEMNRGKRSFGRQVGTYPILVGLEYEIELERFVDIVITSHGYRSITGIEYPFDINHASLQALASLPGIGKKRAVRINLGRPYTSLEELERALDNPDPVEGIRDIVVFK